MRRLRPVLWGGLLAGTLDIMAAFVTAGLQGRGPVRILQGIASGLLGMDSFQGGAVTAVLGAVLHFLIATGAAATYWGASRGLKVLVQQPVVGGLLFGVAVYFFMNLVVLPLSAFPFPVTFTPIGTARGIAIHMLCVGLPISLSVRRFST